MKTLILCCLVLAACAARRTPQPAKWVVTQVRGRSFMVQGRKGWFRQPQDDTYILHVGDTLHINHKKTDEFNKELHRWH